MYYRNQNKRGFTERRNDAGFTLIEMIVSIGLFTIVLFVATSAFLTVLNTDRKSRTVRIAMDNLNLALENMSRALKTSTTYNCWDSSATEDDGGVRDCNVPGESTLSFTGQDGQRSTYTFSDGGVWQKIGSGIPMRITAPEINIESIKFSVKGSAFGPGGGGTDLSQPYILINVNGTVGSTLDQNPASKSGFKIQTIVTQRAYDN